MFKGWLGKIAPSVSIHFVFFSSFFPRQLDLGKTIPLFSSPPCGHYPVQRNQFTFWSRAGQEESRAQPSWDPNKAPWLLHAFQRPHRSFRRPLMILSCSLGSVNNIPDGHWICSAVQASYTDVFGSAAASCWHWFTLATCSFKSHFCLKDVNSCR